MHHYITPHPYMWAHSCEPICRDGPKNKIAALINVHVLAFTWQYHRQGTNARVKSTPSSL